MPTNHGFDDENLGQRMAAVIAVPPASAVPTASFTRPANTTAYAVGNLVANSTTAGSVVPMQLEVARRPGGTGQIVRMRLRKSGAVLTNASFRVHLYRTAPTPTNGDNGAWLTTGALAYIGAFDITLDRAFSDGAHGTGLPLAGPVVVFAADEDSVVLHALLEARAAYTPASGEVFTLAAETVRD